MENKKKLLALAVLTGVLSGCSGFFDKDNLPQPKKLVNFTPKIQTKNVWYKRTGSGSGKTYVRLSPAVTEHAVYTVDKNGTVTANDRVSGKKLWSMRASETITSSPFATDHHVIVCSKTGEVVAISTTNGSIAWKAYASSEILATPAASQGIVVVKSIDGRLSAFDEEDGHSLWNFHQTEPALILRGSSAPQIENSALVAGFANGHLSKLTLEGGSLQWQANIANPEGSFAIDRMIDIDADPIIRDGTIYVATYQGRIAAVELMTGKPQWMYDLSSYTGMSIDDDTVFVTDAKSIVWAFDRSSGRVNWKQDQLEARDITAPATMGNTIVMGDGQGYLHWLNKSDGQLIARTRINKSPIIAAPIVFQQTLYVTTTDGHLATYTIV